jgi:hypothetical protein
MSGSPKKAKNESFNEYRSFRNLYNSDPRIVQSYFKPLHADAAHPRPAPPPGERTPEEQYYCKFANDHVLRAFLYFLQEGELPGLERLDDKEASVGLVIERFEAFKKYYRTNSKEVAELDVAELDRVLAELKNKFLFLENLAQPYEEGVHLEDNGSEVALLVLKNQGNIMLAALKRSPPLPEEDPQEDPQECPQ